MQAVIVAIIGTLGVLLPSLLAVGNAHGRRLRRINEEIATYQALPEQLVQERELVRYVLNESIWEYAVRRQRPIRIFAFAAIGLMSTAAAAVGVQLIIHGGFDNFLKQEAPSTSSYRLLGSGLLLLGAGSYLGNFRGALQGVRRRIARLDGPPSRARQLLALEARKAQGATLASLEFGEPAEHERETAIQRAFIWLMGGLPWEPLDEHASRTSGDISSQDPARPRADT